MQKTYYNIKESKFKKYRKEEIRGIPKEDYTMIKKALSAVLALSICLSVFYAVSAAADGSTAAVQIPLEDALHFIIRHWHSDQDTDTILQGNVTSASSNRHFVVAEGYIVPDHSTYKFYLVYQGDTDDGHKAGEWKEITKDTGFVSDSTYIEDIDPERGTITLKAKPLMKDDNTPLEIFSAFSVSAGHSAVINSGSRLVITYDPYVHLVKAHAFYVRTAMEVAGTQDETVFGNAGARNDEQDTTWVYTYVKDYTDNNGISHKKGEIVKDSEGNPIRKRNDLSDNLTEGENVELTKVYDTNEGLHTDKTAYVHPGTDDGRTFDLDLEAWFAGGYAPQIGMVLDASGSMVFASDIPARIQLTEKQIRELNINTLPDVTGEQGEPDDGWEYYFLTPDQLNQILNPRSTDNSLLSASGYSYFVLNGSDYGPLGYWEGVNTTYQFEESTDSSPGSIINDNNGLQVSGSNGLLLDAQPTSNAFTVSFMIRKGGNTPDKSSGDIAELLYIGPLSGDADKSSFYTLYRESATNSEARLKGNQQAGRGGNVITNINSFFNNATDYRVTLVFDGTRLTSYVNGVVGNNGSGAADLASGTTGVNGGSDYTLNFENPGDIRIILGGVSDNYDGGKLWIDDVYVFDRALDKTAVRNITNETNSLIGRYLFNKGNDSLKNSAGNTYATVLKKQAALFSSISDNTANSAIGPGIAETLDGRILGTINHTSANATIAPSLHHTQAGWYFITHSGHHDNHYKLIGSGKQLIGLNGTQTNKGIEGVNVQDIVTGYTYTNKKADIPTRFYVDAEGNLLCFFSSSNNDDSKCSYVYELEDSRYIRTESLQRALGLFVTELYEYSPVSGVSAVRFSTDNIRDLAELVLLDWTSDPAESTGILSLERGSGSEKGTAIGSTLSSANKLEQYNYGLTGSTSTWRGLQAYIDQLLEHDDPYDEISEDVPKYLIIFTDGADSDHNNSSKSAEEQGKALVLANQLKNDNGYTIFTVLLDGGSMSDESYADAERFLLSLAGKSAYDDPDDSADRYFFSVQKAKEELGDAADGMNDADILMQIFVDKILEEIVNPLENYTVKDYIDPRFDLVDEDGVVWHLNANGSVVKGEGANEEDLITVDSALETQITLSDKSDEIARHPYLCYDTGVQMYYLQWVDQIIPGSAVGANRLAVWNTRFTIRAKNDFLGGNAVLTNGNAAAQNLVFSSDDAAPSSGTDQANYKNNPSKGFPRVTVNVQPLDANQKKELTIYMGEEVSMEVVLTDLIKRAKAEGWYYWEYLERYERNTDADTVLDTEGAIQRAVEELTEVFVKDYDGDETLHDSILKIPYFYLDEFETRSGGIRAYSDVSDKHRKDGLGTMIYSVELPTDELLFSKTSWTVKNNNAIDAVLRAAYMPLDTPQRSLFPATGLEDNRKEANDTLVVEKDESQKGVYLWNEDYKPAAGIAVNNSDVAVGEKIEVVSGEIALQVLISDAAAAKLQSIEKTITYTADLYWGNIKVGTFTAEINADALAEKKVRAAIKYDNTDDFDRAAYGLPLGSYTVKNGRSTTSLPSGFSFGNIMLSNTESDYLPGLFNQGTDNSTPEDYIATVSGSSFILGDKNGEVMDKLYTDYRFGLAQVKLNYRNDQTQYGDLTIAKKITGNAPGTDTMEYTFIITGSAAAAGQSYDLDEGGTVAFDEKGKAEVTVIGESSVTIKDLPVGSYTVTEDRSRSTIDGYTLSVTGEGDTAVTNGGNAVVTVTNTYVQDQTQYPNDVPKTGDKSQIDLWVTLMILSLGGIVMLLSSKKKIE